jgi:hypothetical protein
MRPGTKRSAAVATAVPAAIESASVTEGPTVMSAEPTVAAPGVMIRRVPVMTAGLIMACAVMAGLMLTAAAWVAGAIAVGHIAGVGATASAPESDPGGDQQACQRQEQDENYERRHARKVTPGAVGVLLDLSRMRAPHRPTASADRGSIRRRDPGSRQYHRSVHATARKPIGQRGKASVSIGHRSTTRVQRSRPAAASWSPRHHHRGAVADG